MANFFLLIVSFLITSSKCLVVNALRNTMTPPAMNVYTSGIRNPSSKRRAPVPESPQPILLRCLYFLILLSKNWTSLACSGVPEDKFLRYSYSHFLEQMGMPNSLSLNRKLLLGLPQAAHGILLATLCTVSSLLFLSIFCGEKRIALVCEAECQRFRTPPSLYQRSAGLARSEHRLSRSLSCQWSKSQLLMDSR